MRVTRTHTTRRASLMTRMVRVRDRGLWTQMAFVGGPSPPPPIRRRGRGHKYETPAPRRPRTPTADEVEAYLAAGADGRRRSPDGIVGNLPTQAACLWPSVFEVVAHRTGWWRVELRGREGWKLARPPITPEPMDHNDPAYSGYKIGHVAYPLACLLGVPGNAMLDLINGTCFHSDGRLILEDDPEEPPGWRRCLPAQDVTAQLVIGALDAMFAAHPEGDPAPDHWCPVAVP